jgi:hypothetical protein
MLCLSSFGATRDLRAQAVTPEPAAPLFQDRPFGPRPPPTPTPERKKIDTEDEKPIPLSWIIGGASAAVMAIALLLFFAAGRWRSSNLFDRQYRFPLVQNPPLRFGGKKSGGHLARIQFGPEILPAVESSKTKDA